MNEREEIDDHLSYGQLGSLSTRLMRFRRGRTDDPWLLAFHLSSSSLSMAYVQSLYSQFHIDPLYFHISPNIMFAVGRRGLRWTYMAASESLIIAILDRGANGLFPRFPT
ncbi:hypothetical protein ACFE04_021187 [Oxalis oulophora]